MTGKPITMRRIRRMRAEPRVVSLAGLRDTDGGGKEIDIIDDDSTDETVFEQPKVLRSVLMRAEAESDQTNLGHTTVKTIKAAEEAPRIVPPSIARGDPTSTLKGGVRGQMKRRHSTVNNPPSAVLEAAALKQMSSQLLGEGLVLESGRSTVVKLHQHDLRTFTLHHRGTQGMRVAAYNDAGQPLLDVDLLATEEQQSIVLPLKSDYLVVSDTVEMRRFTKLILRMQAPFHSTTRPMIPQEQGSIRELASYRHRLGTSAEVAWSVSVPPVSKTDPGLRPSMPSKRPKKRCSTPHQTSRLLLSSMPMTTLPPLRATVLNSSQMPP